MSFDPLDFAIHIVNIVILFLILRVLVYKPVLKFMRGREARIANELKAAADMGREAAALKDEYGAKLAAAEDDARDILRDGTNKAAAAAEEIVGAAKAEAVKITDEAKELSERERHAAVAGMKDNIADLAVSLAGKILQREVTAEDNRAAVDEFFSSVDKGAL